MPMDLGDVKVKVVGKINFGVTNNKSFAYINFKFLIDRFILVKNMLINMTALKNPVFMTWSLKRVKITSLQ